MRGEERNYENYLSYCAAFPGRPPGIPGRAGNRRLNSDLSGCHPEQSLIAKNPHLKKGILRRYAPQNDSAAER